MGQGKRPPRRQAPKALTADELARERWLPIPDWDGYEVSDMGRVRSWKRSVKGRPRGENWIIDYDHPPRLRAAALVKGYRVVSLTDRGRIALPKVSRLVLLVFVGEPPENHEAAHWNGVCTDDRVANLRWATRKENSDDKVRHRSMSRGETHGNAKLTARRVAAIRRGWASGNTIEALAKRFGASRHNVRKIVDNNSWRHVAATLSSAQSRRRLSPDDVAEIRRRKEAGETLKQLASAFNKSVRTIWLTVHKKHRRDIAPR